MESSPGSKSSRLILSMGIPSLPDCIRCSKVAKQPRSNPSWRCGWQAPHRSETLFFCQGYTGRLPGASRCFPLELGHRGRCPARCSQDNTDVQFICSFSDISQIVLYQLLLRLCIPSLCQCAQPLIGHRFHHFA